MQIALILTINTDDADEAVREAEAVAEDISDVVSVSVLGPVNNNGGSYVGTSVDGIVAVALTREEADALHNHTEGEVLVNAQDKLREAMDQGDEA